MDQKTLLFVKILLFDFLPTLLEIIFVRKYLYASSMYRLGRIPNWLLCCLLRVLKIVLAGKVFLESVRGYCILVCVFGINA